MVLFFYELSQSYINYHKVYELTQFNCVFLCCFSFVSPFNIRAFIQIGLFQVLFFYHFTCHFIYYFYIFFYLYYLNYQLFLTRVSNFFIFLHFLHGKKTLTDSQKSTGHKFSAAISQPRTTHACSMERTHMGKAVGGFESNKTFSPKKLVIRPRVFKSPISV